MRKTLYSARLIAQYEMLIIRTRYLLHSRHSHHKRAIPLLLQLLQSNSMSTLVDSFCHRQQSTRSIFEPTIAIVQSLGMGQWLKHQMADRDGISANVNGILPAELIWQLYQMVLTDQDLPAESPFSRARLTWQIMHLLPNCLEPEFEAVHRYTAQDKHQLHLYQLSDNIAGLFDKYLIYRPDWLADWENPHSKSSAQSSKPPHWQILLWRKIIALEGMDKGLHRANLHASFLDRLANAKQSPINFERISVFGLSSLPPMHLQTLQALARWVAVDIYFLNPCQHYWGDIVSEKDKSKRSIRRLINPDNAEALIDDDYLEVGNPLLSSMGKQGREFLELLLESDGIDGDELFLPHAPSSILNQIKNDLLDLEFGGKFLLANEQPDRFPLIEGDSSIQIHICHSALREVEILLDQLYLIAQNTDIKSGDIIVMAPNISDYAPFIESVFSGKLQFNITDRPANESSSILAAFDMLMRLPDLRFTASDIMELLETPAISRQFDFDETALALINHWIQAANIRWELDGKSKAENWQLPDSHEFTFLFGLRRLLLGYAMFGGDEMLLVNGIAPHEINPADRAVLGRLCQFIDLLSGYRKLFNQAQSASDWQTAITALINDVFLPDDSEEFALNLVRTQLDRFSEIVGATHFEPLITPQLAQHWLASQLSNQAISRSFISGGITFANLVPMRSIPFKVICLLGMNDKEFPRQDTVPSFDLMAGDYRKGDRSRRHDDRYLFLEALLSAESCFYVSYQGKNQKDNSERPASVLVSELQDYLDRVLDPKQNTTFEHPLQPFSELYFCEEPSQDRHLKSFDQNWYAALVSDIKPSAFIDGGLAADEQFKLTELSQLIAFIKNPSRYFLQTRLAIYFADHESSVQLEDTEPFQLDGLETYQLADSALRVLVAGDALDQWRDWVLAKGDVINAKPGRDQLQQAQQRASAVFEGYKPFMDKPIRGFNAEIELDGGLLSGSLILTGDEIVTYQASKIRKHQQLAIWVQQLFYQATGMPAEAFMIAQHATKKGQYDLRKIEAIEPALAAAHLQTLADLFKTGLARPLPFLPETSWSLFEHFSKDSDWVLARQKSLIANGLSQESSDPNYLRSFDLNRDLDQNFLTHALDVYQPMLAAWEKLK